MLEFNVFDTCGHIRTGLDGFDGGFLHPFLDVPRCSTSNLFGTLLPFIFQVFRYQINILAKANWPSLLPMKNS